MKRYLGSFLALVMLLSLAACGGAVSRSSSSESSRGSDSGADTSSDSSDESSSMAGAGRWDALQVTDEPVELLVTLHNFSPTARCV